jgi:hypothetical protein
MKLQRREKILAGVCMGMAGLAGLWFLLFAGDSRSVDQLLTEKTKYTNEIKEKEKIRDQAARDAKRLAEWQRRSLPPEASLASSLYQNWLSRLTSRTNFHGTKLAANDLGVRRDQFTRISLTLSARARLGDVVQFLYEFYTVGYLHQIRKIELKPIQNSRDLDVSLSIEALSLPTAVSKDRLPTEVSLGLHLANKPDAKLADYRDPIVKRDLFSVYVRPEPRRSPPPPRPPKTIDPGDLAYVTAITTDIYGTTEVWIGDRLAGKSWHLAEGESFTVGSVKGTVEAIRPEGQGEVVIEFDGHQRLLHIGESLHGGVEIPAQPAKLPNPQANSFR